MITVYYEKYWSDYHRKEFVQGFDSLEDIADWIFGQMRRNYSDKETRCMSFPYNNKAFDPGSLPYARIRWADHFFRWAHDCRTETLDEFGQALVRRLQRAAVCA